MMFGAIAGYALFILATKMHGGKKNPYQQDLD
jgi:hypothetical protein